MVQRFHGAAFGTWSSVSLVQHLVPGAAFHWCSIWYMVQRFPGAAFGTWCSVSLVQRLVHGAAFLWCSAWHIVQHLMHTIVQRFHGAAMYVVLGSALHELIFVTKLMLAKHFFG